MIEFELNNTYHNKDIELSLFPLWIKENIFRNELKEIQNGKILELGSRNGANKKWIEKNTSYEYFGVEISDRYQNRDKIYGSLDLISDGVDFDIVLSNNFFSNLKKSTDINLAYRKVCSRIKKDCVWIMIEHEEDSLWLDKFSIENEIYPEIYIPLWNVIGRCSIDWMCYDRKVSLIMWRQINV